MKKESKYLLLSCGFTLLTAACLTALYYKSQKKIVVVDAVKLFNGFRMKTELEKADEAMLKQKKHKCDSIENILRIIGKETSDIPRELSDEYRKAQIDFQGTYENSNREINQQVWQRLNPLLMEFGRAKHFSIIIGANGMGSVLYNHTDYDATAEAILYVNKNYENKN